MEIETTSSLPDQAIDWVQVGGVPVWAGTLTLSISRDGAWMKFHYDEIGPVAITVISKGDYLSIRRSDDDPIFFAVNSYNYPNLTPQRIYKLDS